MDGQITIGFGQQYQYENKIKYEWPKYKLKDQNEITPNFKDKKRTLVILIQYLWPTLILYV